MTLQRLLGALGGRFPAEDRMVPDLERITLLTDLLGNPQRSYPVVHLTGTNGKTSTARMVDALLGALGVRCGRYTSPHLQSVTERICIEGEPLSEERFVAVYDEVAPYVELVDSRSPLPVTFFEVLTAMAFAAFADAPVDAAVLEVGLGGRWDATNVVEAQTCVVTGIGLDHVPLLGSTVGEIAQEKSGIIFPGATVVQSVQPDEAAAVLARRCADVGATLVREGSDFGIVDRRPAVGGQLLSLEGLGGRYDDVFVPLFGRHQASNAAAALAAAESFMGGARLDAEAVREGFAQVRSPGRLEVVRTSPTIILDAAHNAHGLLAASQALAEAFSFTTLVVVFACLGDKDVEAMLRVLDGACSSVVVTESASPRRMRVEDLQARAVEVLGEDRVWAEDRLDDAIDTAVRLAEGEQAYGGAGVLVTGSVVTAGEARTLLGLR